MKKSFLFSIMSIIVIFAMVIGCKKESVTPKLNPNIIRILDCCQYPAPSIWAGGHFIFATWKTKNTIYVNRRLRKIEIDERFSVISDYRYFEHLLGIDTLTIDELNRFNRKFPDQSMNLSNSEDKLLCIYSNYSDVSIGGMYEFDVNSTDTTQLLDTLYNVGAANYFRDDNHIIYYSYGKPHGTNAGYYLFDKTSKKSELIFQHLSEIGEGEVINGFDIHPTQNKLLIPVVYKSKSPLILEYDMDSHKIDTLNVTFDVKTGRICLWLRYDKTGNQILYCSYPRGVLGDFGWTDTEIGILDRNTLSKRVLDANPDKNTKAIGIFPSWSPDNKHILFSSAALDEHHQAIGTYSLYILKNVKL